MYFQLEVDYYSNEANKNKYKNVQLIASTKNNLKIATDCTCNDNLSYLLFGLRSNLLLGLDVAWIYIYRTWKYNVAWKLCLFQQYISRSISIWYILIKTNTLVHNAWPQVYPLLSTNMGVSLLHELIVASLRINKIYIKIDKVKIKPYLHQNHSIG